MRVDNDMRVHVESGTPSPRQIERAQRCAATTDERGSRDLDSRPAASRDPPGEPALYSRPRSVLAERHTLSPPDRACAAGAAPGTHQPPRSAATDRGGRDRGRKFVGNTAWTRCVIYMAARAASGPAPAKRSTKARQQAASAGWSMGTRCLPSGRKTWFRV